jgi:predicted TIM-barrel fold metal-dependent hydrolase
MESADPSRIVFGSDYPFSRHRNPAQDVRDTVAGFRAFDGWDAATRRAVERENALKLFPRLAAAIEKSAVK